MDWGFTLAPKSSFCMMAPPWVTDPPLWWAVFLPREHPQPSSTGQCTWGRQAHVGAPATHHRQHSPQQAGTLLGCLLIDLGGPRAGCQGAQAPSRSHQTTQLHPRRKQNISLFQVSEALLSRLQERSLVLLGKLGPERTLYPVGSEGKGFGTKITFFPFFF